MVGIDRRLPISPPFSDESRDVAMATNFKVKIDKIGLLNFTRSSGVVKRIAISPFLF